MNEDISILNKEKLKDLKLIVFDVDGVLVNRGTNIKQTENFLSLEFKKIAKKQIEQIKELYKLGLKIDINSGRSLYMLQEMFREILPYVSLTYECGSATWYEGKIYQYVNSYGLLKDLINELSKINHKNVKGFEPKEFIITIHCNDRIEEIEETAKKYNQLYCLWNGEAYDIGIKDKQTKANGVKKLIELLKIKKNNVLAIGDNYNDKEMLDEAGIKITADKERIAGDFYIPLNPDRLPAEILMDRILEELK